MVALKKLILEAEPDFYKNLDENFKIFAREIRKELQNEGHVVIGITGYPNSGKSNFTAILGTLIDEGYNFDFNICFIPTSKEIENTYMTLPMYSFFHIDEASRAMHKHKWHEKVQQKLNELYDTEREGHFLCTALIMPRFQNFTENFRNFMIRYWINLPAKGLAVFYKRDEDKDCKDPWHIDENYKKKLVRFKGKRVFERTISDQMRAEQFTDCYWFYCEIPPIPKSVWAIYQDLKKGSRFKVKESDVELESYKDKISREKHERWNTIRKLKSEGRSHAEIGAVVGISTETVRRSLRELEAYDRIKGGVTTKVNPTTTTINIYNPLEDDKINKVPSEFNII